jgi:hypothetical protein
MGRRSGRYLPNAWQSSTLRRIPSQNASVRRLRRSGEDHTPLAAVSKDLPRPGSPGRGRRAAGHWAGVEVRTNAGPPHSCPNRPDVLVYTFCTRTDSLLRFLRFLA